MEVFTAREITKDDKDEYTKTKHAFREEIEDRLKIKDLQRVEKSALVFQRTKALRQAELSCCVCV